MCNKRTVNGHNGRFFPTPAFIFSQDQLNRWGDDRPRWAVDALQETKQPAGKEMRLFLRLLVNDQKQNVTMTFKIVNMTR